MISVVLQVHIKITADNFQDVRRFVHNSFRVIKHIESDAASNTIIIALPMLFPAEIFYATTTT